MNINILDIIARKDDALLDVLRKTVKKCQEMFTSQTRIMTSGTVHVADIKGVISDRSAGLILGSREI